MCISIMAAMLCSRRGSSSFVQSIRTSKNPSPIARPPPSHQNHALTPRFFGGGGRFFFLSFLASVFTIPLPLAHP